MFTGIVEAVAKILNVQQTALGRKLLLERLPVLNTVKIGDSVAINGACLTVTSIQPDGYEFDVVAETLRCTNLGLLTRDSDVNVETSLTLQKPLGGHVVQGHIDAIGTIMAIAAEENAKLLTIQFPEKLRPYLVNKGFIAMDGMSLTVIAVSENTFTVTLIPHTQQATIAGSYQVGHSVNLETDMMAKYVENWVKCRER